MTTSVLVGVDESETSLAAARVAARVAAQSGASLYVLTAYQGDVEETVGVEDDSWTITSEQAGLDLVRRVAGQLDLPASSLEVGAVQGKPGQVLIDEAARVGADLIVVGNRRAQGIGRLLGSVAATVVHHAPCDVYVAKTT